jgi:ribosomal protein L16 Arg81 hydroxylase
MECKFLEDFSLATLVAPLSEAQFAEKHWEKTPYILHRNNPNFYGNLFTLEDFDHAISHSPPDVKTAEAKTKKNYLYESAKGQIPLEHILDEMRTGMTLVLDQLHNREAKLGRLCGLLEQQTGHRFQTNIYLTPPHGQGFTPHWDNHDVFILQVSGTKHWKVEKQRRRLPGRAETMKAEEGRAISEDAYQFTLNQGDMIYIPRGFVHAGECGDDMSLHITLGINHYTWEDFLHVITRAIVLEDENLELSLPLGFLRSDPDDLLDVPHAALRKIGDREFLRAVAARFKEELVTKSTINISGQIVEFFRPKPLALEDKVGPRPGIVYRLKSENGGVQLKFGSRAITFMDDFEEAIRFALSKPSYRVGDLSDMVDENKVALIERLVQEGLVVRQ